MAATRQDIELAFIADQLRWYGSTVSSEMRNRAKQLGIGVTDQLVGSIRYQLMEQSAGQGAVGIIFQEVGRMRDMGAGRGSRQDLSSNSIFTESNDDRRRRFTGRKPAKFYSKVAYGNLDRLIYQLSNYLTDDVVATLKTQLES